MKQTAIAIIFSFLSLKSLAQDTAKKNEVYLEFGSNSLVTAVNYQRQFFSKTGLGIRVGLGTYYFKNLAPVVPLGINYRFGLRPRGSFIDICMGLTYTTVPDVWLYANAKIDLDNPPPDRYFLPAPSVSWVHHSPKGFVGRLSLAIIHTQIGALPNVGFSLGKNF